MISAALKHVGINDFGGLILQVQLLRRFERHTSTAQETARQQMD